MSSCILCEKEITGVAYSPVREDMPICHSCMISYDNKQLRIKKEIQKKRYYLHRSLKDFKWFNSRKRCFTSPRLNELSKTQLKHYNILVNNFKYSVQQQLF